MKSIKKQSNKATKSYKLSSLALLSLPLLMALSSPAQALKIEAYYTSPQQKAIAENAVNAAIAEWESYIKDDVTIRILFSAEPFQGPIPQRPSSQGFLLAYSVTPFLELKSKNASTPEKSFNEVINLIKNSNAKDANKYNIINHLPHYNDFNAKLNSWLLYYFPNTKINSINLPVAVGKVLGLTIDDVQLDPEYISFVNNMPEVMVDGKSIRVDGLVVLNSKLLQNPLAFKYSWDLDPTDGIGSGPNVIPSELVSVNGNFITNPYPDPSIKIQVDFVGAVTHEIGHVLGFLGTADYTNEGLVNYDKVNSIMPMDLFRVNKSDLPQLTQIQKFSSMTRPILWEEGTGSDVFLPGYLDPQSTQVLVYDVKNSQPKAIEMSSGYLCSPLAGAITGDCTAGYETSHLQNYINRVDNTSLDPTSFKMIVQPTYPGLMIPAMLANVRAQITENDLIPLDLIGWSIDYNKNAKQNVVPVQKKNLKEFLDETDLSASMNVLSIDKPKEK